VFISEFCVEILFSPLLKNLTL